MEKWVVVPDEMIRHTWKCPKCGLEVNINPDWYTENGTPVCDCDEDMEYIETLINSKAFDF